VGDDGVVVALVEEEQRLGEAEGAGDRAGDGADGAGRGEAVALREVDGRRRGAGDRREVMDAGAQQAERGGDGGVVGDVEGGGRCGPGWGAARGRA
jgi:hypothetical protein